MKLTLDKAKKIIKQSYNIKVPVILLGSPGIGKTAIFRQLGIDLVIHEGPGLEDVDVKGYVFPDQVNKTAFYGKSVLYPPFDKGILLIDELAAARPEVQVALHSLFGERRLGPYKLPEGVVPMATGNRAQDNAGSRRLLTALEDRLTIIEVITDTNVWLHDFAIPNKLHPLIITFFLNEANKQFLDTFEQRKLGQPFATPRSWEIVSKYLYIWDNEDTEALVKQAVLESKLGAEVATKFLSYMKYAPHIDAGIKYLQDGITSPLLQVNTPDVQFAILISMLHHILQTDIDIEVATERFLKYARKQDIALSNTLLNIYIKSKDSYNSDRASTFQTLMMKSEWFQWLRREYNILIGEEVA